LSHFVTIESRIQNLKAFSLAAESVGLKKTNRKVVNGYRGNKINADAVWEVDEKFDVGLMKNADGTFNMVADWWGTGLKIKNLEKKLKQAYEIQVTLRTAKLFGLPATQKELADGKKCVEIVY
jgi:hypothetical protein